MSGFDGVSDKKRGFCVKIIYKKDKKSEQR